MQELSPFHLAIPVTDLDAARTFYRDIIGCEEGRSSSHWVDFNFFGHQLVIHHSDSIPKIINNDVDKKSVPVPHYGVVLKQKDWNSLAEKLRLQGIPFVIEPYTRFKGEAGEQSTMFFLDPSGNALEFKAFKNISQLFAR
ncbi:MAG: VOC family protein [Crocinitomicaceae bacterium]|nr:VOC family protein [Crocinitomicaceae bacterium]